MSERFEHRPLNFVNIAHPHIVYIGIADRAEFDSLDLPCSDHGENDRGHVLVKSLEASGVMVIFQYWIKSRTAEALLAASQARPKPPAEADYTVLTDRRDD